MWKRVILCLRFDSPGQNNETTSLASDELKKNFRKTLQSLWKYEIRMIINR